MARFGAGLDAGLKPEFMGRAFRGNPKTAWAVLSDPGKNIQFSSQGAQYWQDISATGSAMFNGVIPGTYRLSVYNLGQWGEVRQENVTVTAGQNTVVPPFNFVQENFSTDAPVFTIGAPTGLRMSFCMGTTLRVMMTVSSGARGISGRISRRTTGLLSITPRMARPVRRRTI